MERNPIPSRRPEFFLEGEVVMFRYELDERNTIGPRPATARDKTEYAGAWRALIRQSNAALLALSKDPEAVLDGLLSLRYGDPPHVGYVRAADGVLRCCALEDHERLKALLTDPNLWHEVPSQDGVANANAVMAEIAEKQARGEDPFAAYRKPASQRVEAEEAAGEVRTVSHEEVVASVAAGRIADIRTSEEGPSVLVTDDGVIPVADPLDHDGDGKKGGSRKGEASTRAKGARRKKAS